MSLEINLNILLYCCLWKNDGIYPVEFTVGKLKAQLILYCIILDHPVYECGDY